jgi:hypothetical protein
MSDKPLTEKEQKVLNEVIAQFEQGAYRTVYEDGRGILYLVLSELKRLRDENTEMRADLQALVDAAAKKELEVETAKQARDLQADRALQQALAEAAGRALYSARTGYVVTPLVPGAFIGVSPNRGGALGDSTTAGIGSAPAAKCEPPKSGASFGPQLWADHIWKGKP